jgi:uncharacterized protein YqhQ
MRGPDRVAMAARRADGAIVVRVVALPGWADRVTAVPLLRGVGALVESIRMGLDALRWSATIAEPRARAASPTALTKAAEVLVTGVAIAIAVGVFSAGPALVASWTVGVVGPWGRSAVEAVLGLALLVGYILVVRHQSLVRRTFEYHGAEHKAVAAFEAGDPLVPAAAALRSTRHERCGTTFLLDVAVLSALVHIVTNTVWPTGVEMVLARLVTIPVVAGLAYEIMRATARNADTWWARLLTGPGLALQALTTGEPDERQLEVALVALDAALPTGTVAIGSEAEMTTPLVAA